MYLDACNTGYLKFCVVLIRAETNIQLVHIFAWLHKYLEYSLNTVNDISALLPNKRYFGNYMK